MGVDFCYNTRMNSTKTNVSSKSILARLLANEDLSVVHCMNAETASFNTQSRVLTLPMWGDMSNSLYDMLVGHEVAHALYTPSGDGWMTAIEKIGKDLGISFNLVKQYVNVVEDARIERMIKAAFPGLRRDFFDAYVDLLNRDLFGIDKKDPKDLPLIDRVNLHYKLGLHAGISIPFHATEQVWIDRIDAIQTWDDVLAVVRDMMESLADQDEETDEPDTPESGEGETGDEGTPEEGTPEDGDTEDGDSEDGDSDSPEGDSGEGEGTGDSEDGDSDADPDTMGNQQGTRGIEESITEKALNESVDSMREEERRWDNPVDRELPTVDLDKCIIDFPQVYRQIIEGVGTSSDYIAHAADTRSFIAESRKVTNILAKQFEMKKQADAHKRVQISKTGTLDTVKMMNYKWSEDVFRKTATVREGKNHGLVMFIDWSGSMSDCIQQTMDQMVQLVLFCKKVNIPFEVYAFTSHFEGRYNRNNATRTMWSNDEVNEHDWVSNDTGLRSFNLLNLFSSRMNKRQFDSAIIGARYIAAANATYQMVLPAGFNLGSTPLDESIVAAFQIIPEFQTRNNVQIVNTVFMTDGCSDGNSITPSDRIRVKGQRIGVRSNEVRTTAVLLDMLQQTTNTNAIGMFLSDASDRRFEYMGSHFETEDDMETAKGTWKSDNYAIATRKGGYAENFLIKSKKRVDNKGIEDLPENASNTRIKNAFLKSAGAKMTSRVVLNRFIDIIA